MELLSLLLGMGAGAAIPGYLFHLHKKTSLKLLGEQKSQHDFLVRNAQDKADAILREAELARQKESIRLREELDRKEEERQKELGEIKRRLDRREESLDRKFEQLDHRETEQERTRREMERERKGVEEEKERLARQALEIHQKLEHVAGLTSAEAKQILQDGIEEEARKEAGRLVKQLEEEARATAEKTARDFIITAIQRFAGEYVAEQTVSVVAIPSDEMKGRIIGREGRNIRALEAATGCDLIIDDTPEAVVISGFNPVRRAVAKRVLDELVTDGRIHPARIEEVVRKVKKAINQEIKEAGEQAVFDLGLHNVHPEIVRLLGTLKFRTSYTQNVLAHSMEVAFFAGIIADELGLDAMMARRAALLHDIGKAVDHEVEGSHADIGAQLAKKYKEHPFVINAIASHHFEVEPTSVYGPLVNAADALSAARPGARRESLENYVNRLQDLEKVAASFRGVEKAFAIQAGREVRVMVSYDRVNDEGAMLLARDIARKVEEELTYPGQIKITVIREMRATEIAH